MHWTFVSGHSIQPNEKLSSSFISSTLAKINLELKRQNQRPNTPTLNLNLIYKVVEVLF